jgi:uncharacterized membrane protein YqgA involved in biofilm formation
LGFQNSDALMVNVVIGTVVAAMAALEAWITHTGERAPKSISR